MFGMFLNSLDNLQSDQFRRLAGVSPSIFGVNWT